MSETVSASPMPVYRGLEEPVSVLAARAIRAGLMRRAEGMRAYGGLSPRDSKAPLINRNLLERGVPATSLQPPELARFFQRWWPVVRAHTFIDRHRAESLIAVLWQAREVDGDIVECGSFRCGIGFLLALAVREWGLDKKVHLYDSFEGLPSLTQEDHVESEETFFYEGQFQRGVDLDMVQAFLNEHDLTGIVELHKGWFDETLPAIPRERRFCFAHIDCDLYKSALACWTYLLPHMQQGAGIVVDDYDSYGMYTASWEYLNGTAYPLYTGVLKQAHFFMTPGATRPGHEDWSPLLANRPYCAYLAGVCAEMIVAASSPVEERDEHLNDALDRLLGPQHKVPFLEYFIAYLYGQEALSIAQAH